MRSTTFIKGAVIAATLATMAFSPLANAQNKVQAKAHNTSLFSKHKLSSESLASDERVSDAPSRSLRVIMSYDPTPMPEPHSILEDSIRANTAPFTVARLQKIAGSSEYILFGEIHNEPPQLGMMADALDSLRKAGVSALALELLDPRIQADVDQYMQTGVLSRRLFDNVYNACHPKDAFFASLYLLERARLLGFEKIIAISIDPESVGYPNWRSFDTPEYVSRANVAMARYNQTYASSQKEKTGKTPKIAVLTGQYHPHGLQEFLPGPIIFLAHASEASECIPSSQSMVVRHDHDRQDFYYYAADPKDRWQNHYAARSSSDTASARVVAANGSPASVLIRAVGEFGKETDYVLWSESSAVVPGPGILYSERLSPELKKQIDAYLLP